MKKVVNSFFGVLFALAATNASADGGDFGVIPQSVLDPFETVVDASIVVGDFEDVWTFTLEQEGDVSVSVDNLPNVNNGVLFLNIEDLETTLLAPGGGAIDSFSDSGNTGTFTLDPGMYSVLIAGTGTGVQTQGGFYSVAVTVVTDVSAVPIPAAGLLFFSGIAALGLVRSKRASAAI